MGIANFHIGEVILSVDVMTICKIWFPVRLHEKCYYHQWRGSDALASSVPHCTIKNYKQINKQIQTVLEHKMTH